MRFLLKTILVIAVVGLMHAIALAQVPTATVKAIDPKATYRLSNDFTGPNKFLTISENGVDLNMVDATRSPKQLWIFSPWSESSFRLVSLSNEEASIDVHKHGDVYSVVMAELGDFSGQSWTFVTEKDGKLRFSNKFAGHDRSLDVLKNGDVYSVVVNPTGDYTGQAWTLTKVNE